METKTILVGLGGFILGGLLVAVAATMQTANQTPAASSMSMSDMSKALEGKTGDAYDRVFLETMIEHHQGAVEMAQQSGERAGHEEIKTLSRDILTAQESEIAQMRAWQKQWGYAADGASAGQSHGGH